MKMMKTLMMMLAAVSLGTTMSPAATLNVAVSTDRTSYFPGQTVQWTITAWASSGDNAGIALLSVSLNDDLAEPLNPALNTVTELTDTEYGLTEGFTLASAGTPAATSPRLRDILIFQSPVARTLNIGNDNVPHVLCRGSYVVNTVGTHSLIPTINAGNYWPDASANAMAFEVNLTTSVSFGVLALPAFCGDTNTVYLDGDLATPQDCYVNVVDFSVLHLWWLENSCVGPSWCAGADINQSGIVDMTDGILWVGDWLKCTDPANAACDPYWLGP